MKFSATDLDRIKAAVKESEEKISGEIVPVVVDKSGYYTISKYRSAALVTLITFILLILFQKYFNPILVTPVSIFLLVATSGVVGFVLPVFFRPIDILMTGQHYIGHATRHRAENAFLEEEVFNTRHRTGILIFISTYEREVIIMADRGISRVVDQKKWERIVNDLNHHLLRDQLVEGLEKAIKESGMLLEEHGFYKRKDDTNELRDDLRTN